jgi:hypothetical protein
MTSTEPDVDNGPGDSWEPGSLRYIARTTLTKAIEAFVDAVQECRDNDNRPPRDFEEWTPLRDALERWRNLGRDGE